MSARTCRAVGALLLLALVAAAPFAAAADAAGPIGATVEIRQSAMTASLYGAASDVRVTVAATVHIRTERGHFVDLGFSVAGTSWPVEVTPATFRTQTATDLPVTVAVDVPRSAAEGVYELTLRATDPDDLFPIDTEAPFTVSVFRGPIAIFAVAAGGAVLPNGTARWDLTIRNLGAADIEFEFAVAVPDGYTFTIVNPPVQIVRGHTDERVKVTLRIPAAATAGDAQWTGSLTSSSTPAASTTISVHFEVARITAPPPAATPDFLALYWLPLTLGMVAIGIIAYVSLTEVGYLALSFSILVPLFTRIRHEKVLDNFTRGQIFGYIQANPGAHYSAIQEVLDIENGQLAYHLRVLMREEFVVARNEGVFKRFYPRDYKIPRGRTLLTRLQVDILETVEKAPGTSQREVAHTLSESKQVISYNVGVLRDAGLVIAERRGHDVLLRAASTARRDPEDPASSAATPSDLIPQ